MFRFFFKQERCKDEKLQSKYTCWPTQLHGYRRLGTKNAQRLENEIVSTQIPTSQSTRERNGWILLAKKNWGTHRRKKVDEKSCVTFLLWPRLVRPTNLISRMNGKKTHTHTTHCMFWCPYMVSVQSVTVGFSPIWYCLLTLCDSIGEPFECHVEFMSLQPLFPPKPFD